MRPTFLLPAKTKAKKDNGGDGGGGNDGGGGDRGGGGVGSGEDALKNMKFAEDHQFLSYG